MSVEQYTIGKPKETRVKSLMPGNKRRVAGSTRRAACLSLDNDIIRSGIIV
jgi:hypothetical protein